MDLVLHTDASYRNDLDTGKFARMLDDPSQCYKFYWLEAILNLLPTEEGDLSFEKIIDEMICDAWYSVTRYKLHLGPTIRGKCENALERAINVINRDDQMSYASSKDEIMHGIEQHQTEIRADKLTLTINVPYRLLSSFLDEMWVSDNENVENKTIAYYDDPSNAYADQTLHADMSAIYERFEKYLAPVAAVLDAGCGSGRDSLHFMKAGYAVSAIDASQEMCAFASRLLQQEVRQLRFQELDYEACFDGIWACASLLHVPERQQAEVFHRLMRALVPRGVLYASWKYGETERTEASSGRLFCDMTEQRAEALAQTEDGVSIETCWISEDVRADRRSQKWLNVIFRKET